MIEALKRTRAVAVTIEGTVYEARDPLDGDMSVVEKRKIRSADHRGEWFTVPRSQFEMYARMGFHSVMLWEVTDGEFTDLLHRVTGMNEASRVTFAQEQAVAPPEPEVLD